MKYLIIGTITVLGFVGGLALSFSKEKPTDEVSLGLAVCTVTSSVVTIGHQQSLTVLSAAPGRTWAIIQQPPNATNTVSLSIGGTAVARQGYTLVPDTVPDVASSTAELRLGFSTDLPTSEAVTARTASASSTLNVIECK